MRAVTGSVMLAAVLAVGYALPAAAITVSIDHPDDMAVLILDQECNFVCSCQGAVGNVTFTWDFGDDTENPIAREVSHTYDTPWSYYVTVTAVDDMGGDSPQSPYPTKMASKCTSLGATW